MRLVGFPQSLVELFHVAKKTWRYREVSSVASCSGAHLIVRLQKPHSCHAFVCEETAFTGPSQRNPRKNGLEQRSFCWVGGGFQPFRASWAPAGISQLPGKAPPGLRTSSDSGPAFPPWKQSTDRFFCWTKCSLNVKQTPLFWKKMPPPLHTRTNAPTHFSGWFIN